MYSHINLKTDKLIAVKTYVRIDENIKNTIKQMYQLPAIIII